jgi:ABC-2 type transport system ATP-binding protein
MENMIIVKDFVKTYGDFTVVDHVSFEVKSGSIFAFLGPNGAGKSTTIQTLCTMLEKTSGTLLIDGKDASRDQDAVRSVIGVVFQDSTLDNKMTVEENLKMHCHFYGLPKSVMNERIHFVLDLVDMMEWKKALASSLSGGMKRRIEIARSLLHFPKVLFLDEPTTGLDPQTRAHIWAHIVKLQQEKNITIFFTTHYMEEAEISDQVAIMDKGKIIAIDQPSSLKKQYAKDKIRITSKNGRELESLLYLYDLPYKKAGCSYFIETNDLSDLLDIMSEHKAFMKDLEVKKGTLNDVFLEITGKDIRGSFSCR